MRNVGIITIIDNNNFGNRLQNYALYKVLSNIGVNAKVIINYDNGENKFLYRIKRKIKHYSFLKKHIKVRKFDQFNKYISFTNYAISKNDKDFDKVNDQFDAFIVGSDQVWNPNFGRLNSLDLLDFTNKVKISYAASFGVTNISDVLNKKKINCFNDFDFLSVRESSGKDIIKNILPNKKVEVLVDPTLLLSDKEWDKVTLKPKGINNKKYIFCYFLGNISESVMTEIKRVAIENDCEIVNIFDESKPWFASGPSEFLWLEKNAFLICTDSFHSSVFGFLYNRPFIIFERKDSFKNMSSRLDSFIEKFELLDRKYNNERILKENLKNDYSRGYKILDNERKKSISYLTRALDIKDRKD